jgi:hypothetical protein
MMTMPRWRKAIAVKHGNTWRIEEAFQFAVAT